MGKDLEAQRVTELLQAFRSYQTTIPELRVEVVGRLTHDRALVHPVAGFHVRLTLPGGPGGAALYISSNYAELTRWGGGGAIRERFSVQLGEEFVWGDSAYQTASDLAHDLLAYLQFNLDAAVGS
jgi:hypothetical protein